MWIEWSNPNGTVMTADQHLKAASAFEAAAGALRLDASVSVLNLRAPDWSLTSGSGDACFVAVLQGPCHLTIAGEQNLVLLQSGDLLIVRQDAEVQISGLLVDERGSQPRSTDEVDEARLLQARFRVRTGTVAPLWNGVAPLLRIKGEAGKFRPWVAGLLNVIQAELISGQERMPCVVNQLVTVLLLKALREADVTASAGPATVSFEDAEINQVLATIHKQPEVPWTVARLADTVDLSRSAFAARFVVAVGRPPMEYLREFRLAEAQRLLKEGEHGMKEIASRAGYRTASAFSIAFKREFGMTPGEFRASSR